MAILFCRSMFLKEMFKLFYFRRCFSCYKRRFNMAWKNLSTFVWRRKFCTIKSYPLTSRNCCEKYWIRWKMCSNRMFIFVYTQGWFWYFHDRLFSKIFEIYWKLLRLAKINALKISKIQKTLFANWNKFFKRNRKNKLNF